MSSIAVFIFDGVWMSVLYVILIILLILLAIGCLTTHPSRQVDSAFQFLFSSFPPVISTIVALLMWPDLLFFSVLNDVPKVNRIPVRLVVSSKVVVKVYRPYFIFCFSIACVHLLN